MNNQLSCTTVKINKKIHFDGKLVDFKGSKK